MIDVSLKSVNGAKITPYMTHSRRYNCISRYIGDRFNFLAGSKRQGENVLIADFGPGYPPEGLFNMSTDLSRGLLDRYEVNARFAGVERNMLTAVANCDDVSFLTIGDRVVSYQFPESFTETLKIDEQFNSVSDLAGAKIPIITNPYMRYQFGGLLSFISGDIFDPSATGLRPDISIMSNVMVYYRGQETRILSAFKKFLAPGSSLLVVESCQYGFNGSIFTFRKHENALSCDEIVFFGDPTSYEDIHDFDSTERLKADTEKIYTRKDGLSGLSLKLNRIGYHTEFDPDQAIPFVRITPLREQNRLGSIEHFLPLKK